ncbi:HIRAN domain-containing protein [Hymenobacter negativus]|uniref:HIRAN domain-containing protein n=1 Tax=Hymenobacter negativus TaxID=2795026 RepID=A0ABS0Q8I1_9BACT|nr:HIRAN domain-containing protein [Hymenobacter negativus]MBH8558965.1 HIRAN domain-containing protein [Hymenobacter negativus]
MSFPDFYQVYQQPTLFANFHNRLLPTSRPDYADFLSWLAVSSETATDHPLVLLDRTNGTRQTDAVELFRRPSIQADGSLETCFFIRGLRYRSNEVQALIDKLSPGTQFLMALDIQNPQDSEAVLLRTADDIVVPGYLPRHLVPLTSQLLRTYPAQVKVVVEKINPAPAPVQLRLLCRLQANDVPTDLPALRDTMYDELIRP